MECKENKNVIDNSNTDSDRNNVSRRSNNCIEDISQPADAAHAMLGTTSNKNDLKLKISKLEAYSRQLCLNLKDLQKNREDITGKTLAFAEELQCPSNENDEDISSETDIHVLLRAKSGCCTICKGYEEWEGDLNDDESREEINDDRELVKSTSVEMIDTSDCRCCICCENRISYENFCDKCNNNGESTFSSNSSTNFSLSFDNVDQAVITSSLGYSNVCCNVEEPSNDRCYKICKCDQDDNVEERCRGGVDCIEAPQRYAFDISSFKRKRSISKDHETCCIRDLRDSSSASLSCIGESILIEQIDKTHRATDKANTEELQTPLRDGVPLKLEQDQMIVALAQVSKNHRNSMQTHEISSKKNNLLERRFEDCCNDKMNDPDRSSLLKYLAAIDELSRREAKNEKTSVDDETSKCNLLIGLSVLFLIVLSRAFRYPNLSSLSYHLNNILPHRNRIFDRISLESIDLQDQIVIFVRIFKQYLALAATNFVDYVNFISSHLTFFGAVFGSVSFAKSLWSLMKILFPCLRKDSYELSRLAKYHKSAVRCIMRMIFCAKSQYYFLCYISCLALGFLAGKASRIVEQRWYGASSLSILKNHQLAESDIR